MLSDIIITVNEHKIIYTEAMVLRYILDIVASILFCVVTAWYLDIGGIDNAIDGNRFDSRRH